MKIIGGMEDMEDMDIRSLGLLTNMITQSSINSMAGTESGLSFPQVFSGVMGTNQISVTDLLSAIFPTNDVNVKVGNCNVNSKTWQRKDFPSWRYFQDNVLAASYGDDPVLYQKTKSYCLRLDEEGKVKDYMVVSGGIDTQKSDDTGKVYVEAPQKRVVRAADQRAVQRRYGNR